MNAPRSILVVKLRALGDAVIATPVLRTLRTAYPRARLTVLTTPPGGPIFQASSMVDEVLIYGKRIVDIPLLLWRLRQSPYDIAINLHASPHSAWITKHSGATHCVVDNHSGENVYGTVPLTAPKEPKSAIERDLDAVRALGLTPVTTGPEVQIPPEAEKRAAEWFRRHGMDIGRGRVVAVNPGAGRSTKRWPLDRFRAVITSLVHEGNRVLVLLGPGEDRLGEELLRGVERHGRIHVIAEWGILEIAALLSRVQLLIGNDSGLHHLAAALHVRSVTLFGPELPREWHPYHSVMHPALTAMVHCVNCGLTACDRLECQYLIHPNDVLATATPLLVSR